MCGEGRGQVYGWMRDGVPHSAMQGEYIREFKNIASKQNDILRARSEAVLADTHCDPVRALRVGVGVED